MTPLQFAKEQCANYLSNGGCAGILIGNDFRPIPTGVKPKCVLADGKRCQYFEECVLPMGIEPINAANVIRLEEKMEADRLYRKMTGAMLQRGKICPQCKEREVPKRHRFCLACSAEHRRKARNASRKASDEGS